MVTTIAGVGAAKNAVVSGGKAAGGAARAVGTTVREGAEALANGGKLAPAVGAVSTGGGTLAATAPDALNAAAQGAKAAGIFAIESKNVSQGTGAGSTTGGSASSASPAKPKPKKQPEVTPPERQLTGQTQGKANAIRGNQFELDVLDALGAEKGTNAVTEVATRTTTIPDLPIGKRFGVTDIKDVSKASLTKQLKAQLAAALTAGEPFNLIVGVGTRSVSKPLQAAIQRTGGRIFQFDQTSRKFNNVVFDPQKANRIVR